jgi:hypothetical protein
MGILVIKGSAGSNFLLSYQNANLNIAGVMGYPQYRCTNLNWQRSTPVVEQMTTAPSGVGVICLGNNICFLQNNYSNSITV